jgi:hypothetical protein
MNIVPFICSEDSNGTGRFSEGRQCRRVQDLSPERAGTTRNWNSILAIARILKNAAAV